MEVRADISTRGCDDVVDKGYFLNAQRHENKTLKRCCELNEHEKKRYYNSRIIKVEQGSFTPFVFSVTGTLGRECSIFAKCMCQIISLKRKEELSVVRERTLRI